MSRTEFIRELALLYEELREAEGFDVVAVNAEMDRLVERYEKQVVLEAVGEMVPGVGLKERREIN